MMEFNRQVNDHTPPLSTFTPPPGFSKFNYRPAVHTPPLTFTQSPSPAGFSYFANQSFSVAGHVGRGLTGPYQLEGPNSAIQVSEFIRRELEKGKLREEIMQSVLRQIQKERIRDEIIVDEILRRRFMKADVGRELALPGLSPHEMLRRARGSLPLEMVGPRASLPHEMVGRPIGESFAGSLECGLGMSSEFRCEFGCFGTGLQMKAEANVSDDKLQLGLEDLEEEIVWTGKPLQDLTQLQNGNQNTRAMKVNQDLVVLKKGGSDGENYVSEAHREGEANVGAETSTENPAKLLPFWCDVCQIGTNTENAMEEHKAGKKHHQKEQLFRFWCDVCKIGTDTKDGMETHKAGNKYHLAHNKQLRFWCNVCQIGTNTETVMEKHKAGKKHLANKKELFRFWCDECQIGTDTEIVMEKHKAGNKHRSRLQEINQNPGGEPPNLVLLPVKEAEADSIDLKNSFKLLKHPSLSSDVSMKKDEVPVQIMKETRGLKKSYFKFWCDVCQMGTNTENLMEIHKTGKKHLVNKKKLFRFWCDECQIGTDTENVMEKHKAGNNHLSRLQEINQNPGDEPPKLVMLPTKEAEVNSLDSKNNYKLLKKDEVPVLRAKETRGLKKNSFKYWCDICQLGADSEEVLKNHRYGKKTPGSAPEMQFVDWWG